MFKNRKWVKVLIVALLLITCTTQQVTLANGPTIKNMDVEFYESMERNPSKTVNIRNLQRVVGITVNNGSVSHTVNGDNVTIYPREGDVIYRYNPTKDSINATDYRTSSSDSFNSTYSYNSNGYSGTLSRNGSSYVSSGSSGGSKYASETRGPQSGTYFPEYISVSSGAYSGSISKDGQRKEHDNTSRKTVSDTRTSSFGSFPSTMSYNSGGYSGTLTQDGPSTSSSTQKYQSKRHVNTQYVNYGSDGEGDHHVRTYAKYVPYAGYFCNTWNDSDVAHSRRCAGYNPGTGDYDDHISTTYETSGSAGKNGRVRYDFYAEGYYNVTEYKQKYSGEVTSSDVTYSQDYSGNITKPDTRIYRQNYYGVAYKPGDDSYYKYSVNISYVDNTPPKVSLTSPSDNIIRSTNPGYTSININGGFVDPDIENTVSVYYSMDNGSTRTIKSNVKATGGNQLFSENLDVSDLSQGNHTLRVWAKDSAGDTSNIVTRTIRIDKTPPSISISPNGNSKGEVSHHPDVNISDNMAGVKNTRYSWSKSKTNASDWKSVRVMTPKNENGLWYLHMETEDYVGNEFKMTSNAFNLDNIKPTVPSISQSSVWNKANVTVTIKDGTDENSGIDRTEYRLTGATSKGWTRYTGPITISNEGKTTIYSKSIDKAGNESTEVNTEVKLDKTVPLLSITTGSETWKKTPTDVTMTYSDPNSGVHGGVSGIKTKKYKVTKDKNKPTSWDNLTGSSSQVAKIDMEGTYYVHAQIIDNANNETYAYGGPYRYDKTKTTVPVINAKTNWEKANIVFTLTHGSDGTGDVSGLKETQYKLTGATTENWKKYTGPVTVTNEGQTKIEAKTIDIALNESTIVNKTVQLDKTVPKLDVTAGSQTWKKTPIPVTIVYSDPTHNSVYGGVSDIEVKRYQITKTTNKPTSGWVNMTEASSKQIIIDTEGTYYVHAQIIDKAKNETYVYGGPYKYDKTPTTLPKIETSTIWEKKNVSVKLIDGTDGPGDVSGFKETQYRLSGATNKGWTVYKDPFTISEEGQTKVDVKTIDIALNETSIVTKTVKVDKTIPLLGITAGSATWKRSPIPVTITFSDPTNNSKYGGVSEIKTKQYVLNQSTAKPTAWQNIDEVGSKSISISTEGEWYVHANIEDHAGNVIYLRGGPYKYDNTKPIMTKSTLTPSDWTPEKVKIDFTFNDPPFGDISQSGVASGLQSVVMKAPTKPLNKHLSFSNTNLNGARNFSNSLTGVTENEEFEFVVTDMAGNVQTHKIDVWNIDDVNPRDYDLQLTQVLSNNIKAQVTGAHDYESGLQNRPFWFLINELNHKEAPRKINMKDTRWENTSTTVPTGNAKISRGGNTSKEGPPVPAVTYDANHVWTAAKNIKSNTKYQVASKTRDLAMNETLKQISRYTLTSEFDFTYNKQEGTNEADLIIDLKNNPSYTDTMITRVNLSTGDAVTIKDWNDNPITDPTLSTSNGGKTVTKNDRVTSYGYGFKYTAYVRNGDGITSVDSKSVEIREPEEPEINLKGFGSDKFVWDKDTNTIFIIGKNSGYVTAEIHTIATERLGYNWKTIGSTNIEVDDYEDKRVGEVRYKINLPIENNKKQKYKLSMKTVIVKDKDLDIAPEEFTVHHIPRWSDLVDLKSNGNLPLSITQKALSNPKGEILEILNNAKIKEEIKKGFNIEGKPSKPNETVNIGSVKQEITITKTFDGGTYTEILKPGRVSISTNIGKGVTEGEEFQLEGSISIVEENKTIRIPQDLKPGGTDGWNVEMIVTENHQLTETEDYKKWQEMEGKPNKKVYKNEQIKTFKPKAPFNATIGFKVTKLIPTYKFETLNLQKEGFRSGESTLEAYGNANIQYDKDYLFNRITNKAVLHKKPVHADGRWLSELYYRAENGERELVMVTREGISLFDINTLEHIKDYPMTNTGSILQNNKLYIGTSGGIKLYTSKGSAINTKYTDKVNHIVTNGANIFVADDTGLDILNSDFTVFQRLENNKIHPTLSRIRSLHVSQNVVYAGYDDLGNKFMPIGK